MIRERHKELSLAPGMHGVLRAVHPHQPMRTCSKCGKGLFPRYDLAALKRVLADGVVGAEATIVLLNTGSGLKYLELVE